jgi:uncharacterized protein (TIGR02145 family)
MKKIILLLAALAFLTLQNYAQTVTDIDGNVYNTVTIGTQRWMKENLKVTHYRNGDKIKSETDGDHWINLTTGAYCFYNNDSVSYAPVYGALYNWNAVSDNRNIAPEGWHIPDTNEWNILTTYLGGRLNAGEKMKDTGVIYWQSPDFCADNSSGFTSLPGGFRYYSAGIFGAMNEFATYWSVLHAQPGFAWHCYNWYWSCYALIGPTQDVMGLSVRCIKDTAYDNINEIDIDNRLQLYPNPATDNITINAPEAYKSSLCVYNIIGDLVLQQKLYSYKTEINISTLPSGIYIIKVTGMDWTVQRKIIKE